MKSLLRLLPLLALTFVAPHSLHARPLVVPRGADEGSTFELADAAFTLTVGKPVRFDLYVSERVDDVLYARPGDRRPR